MFLDIYLLLFVCSCWIEYSCGERTFLQEKKYLFAADGWVKNRPSGYPEGLFSVGNQQLLLGLDAELLGDVFRNSRAMKYDVHRLTLHKVVRSIPVSLVGTSFTP